MAVDKRTLIQGRDAQAIRWTTEQDSSEHAIQDAIRIRWASRRWIKIYEASGELSDTGGTTEDWESDSLDIWPYDEIVAEYTLDDTQDIDFGIRFYDIADATLLTNVNIRDYDTAAILDIGAIFQTTGEDVKATGKVYQMFLDHTIPKFKMRVFVENDHATDDPALYTVKVYGRILT